MVKKKKDFKESMMDMFGDEIGLKEYPEGHPSVSTNSLALDVSIGVGGIPLARYTEIYGPEQGGKSTLCLGISKNALNLGYKVLYIEPENKLTYEYVQDILGDSFDPDRMVILQPHSAENAFTIAEAGIDAGFQVIVFDSVAAISPEAELSDPIDKDKIALPARKLSQFLRKTVFKVRANETALIFTNQVRANIGSYFGGYSTPGGYALGHYTSLRIYLSKGKEIKDSDDATIGHNINFIIKKNNVAMPYRSASTNLIYGSGIDYERDALQFAAYLGIIKTRGSYYAFQENVIAQGTEKTVEALRNDKELLDKIVEMCYNIANVKFPPFRKEVTDDDKDD